MGEKGAVNVQGLRDFALLAGRIFMAALFIYDAALLVHSPAGSIAYMQQFGVPGLLLYPTAVFELLAGFLIAMGLAVRAAALGLATFCLLTALIFHHDLSDINESIQFGKDLGLAGGFLLVFAGGAGRLSLNRHVRRGKS